jgi:hypothetical protein
VHMADSLNVNWNREFTHEFALFYCELSPAFIVLRASLSVFSGAVTLFWQSCCYFAAVQSWKMCVLDRDVCGCCSVIVLLVSSQVFQWNFHNLNVC